MHLLRVVQQRWRDGDQSRWGQKKKKEEKTARDEEKSKEGQAGRVGVDGMGKGGQVTGEREERGSERGSESEREGEDYPAALQLIEVAAQLIAEPEPEPEQKAPHTHTAGR